VGSTAKCEASFYYMAETYDVLYLVLFMYETTYNTLNLIHIQPCPSRNSNTLQFVNLSLLTMGDSFLRLNQLNEVSFYNILYVHTRTHAGIDGIRKRNKFAQKSGIGGMKPRSITNVSHIHSSAFHRSALLG